jgi:hypothetical protein
MSDLFIKKKSIKLWLFNSDKKSKKVDNLMNGNSN